MLQLLSPIWLLSIAGIAFPVIIHLWNNKQGKVLRIGSIALLEKGSRRQARSNRISEWWLLLLRCLLLLLLALLLSAPFWRIASKGEQTKGWILGMKSAAQEASYKTLTDSLLKIGYEWHEWQGKDYWDLFRTADREAPATVPFYIFTDKRQAAFTGGRPVSGRTVHWFTTMPSTDSIRHWIERAWLCSPDSIRVLAGNSRLTGNVYSYQMLPAKSGVNQSPVGSPIQKDSLISQEAYQVRFLKGRLSVALDSQPPVMVDTAPLHILIYADPVYNNDSRYVAGAIRAWQQFTRQNIQVTISGSFPNPAARLHPAGNPNSALGSNPAPPSSPGKDSNTALRFDWIFWLSPTTPPANLPAQTILCYEPGREIPVDTWMQGVPGVALSRRIEPDVASDGSKESPAIWKDGFGQPLLTRETRSGRRIFHLFSHFDPAWNGLVWSPRFPLLLENLLIDPASTVDVFSGTANAASDRDLRVLDPEQITPQNSLAGDSVNLGDSVTGLEGSVANLNRSRQPLHTIDLAPVCWLLILLVFVAERILAFRSPKIKTDG